MGTNVNLTPEPERFAQASVESDRFNNASEVVRAALRLLEERKALHEMKLKRLREAVAEVVGYLERHAHRMEYPEYLAQGWCIGSGAVESACKTVVGQRLKLAGMRWGEDGAHALCHLRALYRSDKGQWQAFWNGDFTPN